MNLPTDLKNYRPSGSFTIMEADAAVILIAAIGIVVLLFN